MPLLPTRAGTSDGPHPQPHPQHNPSPSPSEVETCHRCRTPLPLFLLSACGLLLLLQLLLPAHAFIVPSTSCSSSSRIRAASTTRRHATTVPAPSSSAAASIIPASYTGPVYMEDAHKDTKAALPPPIKGKSAPVEDTSLKPFLEHIIAGASLSSIDVEAAFDRILAGADPVQVGALLAMLRQRGETPVEIAGMVRAMLKQRFPVNVTGKLLDIVGTGGDGAHTINISTAAIVLAAACGAKAAKLGNRSVSSKCGSADVLEALGIDVELSAEQVAECIETTGVGFMFAPVVHPAMKKVAPVRKALGVRTAFNIVGPLLNAAGAQHVVVGVFQERLLELLAGTLMEIGTVDVGLIIHGAGLDEISPLGPSKIVEIRNVNAGKPELPRVYEKRVYELDPEKELGVPRCTIEELRGGDAEENAALLREVLAPGEHKNAKRDSVVLNAAAGLYAYGDVSSIEEGVKKAYSVLASGAAIKKLDEWIACSKELKKRG